MSRVHTEVDGFRNTPEYRGAVAHVTADGAATVRAVLQGFVYNQGDGWAYTGDYLVRFLDERRLPGSTVADVPMEDLHGIYLAQAATLGLRTGEMHRALAIDTDDQIGRAWCRERVSKNG